MIGLPAVHDYNKEWFQFYFYDIFPYITPLVIYPIGMIAQTGSVGCTICVTIERYVAVCLPLKSVYLQSSSKILKDLPQNFIAI